MKRILIITLLLIFSFSETMAFYENLIDEDDELFYVETVSNIGVPTINARAAILYDLTYDRILYEKNPRQKRANASTTKMITALVALEYGNLEDIVQISSKAAGTGGSSINLKTGDKLSLDDLIKGLLIHSGNDAAVAIAEHISGSVDKFADLMNEKAIEIGALDTHFVTPHGLDQENHYSTAYDLLLIAKEVLNEPYLANIVSQKSVEIHINDTNRIINTTNEMLSLYNGANGIKTGYTGEAGRCLIASAKQNERQLISVILGCDSKKNRTIDSTRLLNYGFEYYKVVNLADFIKKDMFVIVEKSEESIYKIKQRQDILYPLTESEIGNIEVKYNVPHNLVAPIKKGQIVGNIRLLIDGNLIKEIMCEMPDNIGRKTWKQYFYQVFIDSLENYENMVEKMFKI